MTRRSCSLALMVLVLTLTGCGQVRWETDDVPLPAIDAAERQRQDLAEQTWQLAQLAHDAAHRDPDRGPVMDAVVEATTTQLEALGGLWYPAGRHLVPIAATGEPADVMTALTSSATDLTELAVAGTGDQARLLAGIAVTRLLLADQIAHALDLSGIEVVDSVPESLDPTGSADLIRTLDALGQAWEVAAARADGTAASDDAATASRWRARAQQLAELAGVADTPDDPRAVAYDLDVADLDATIADLRSDLVVCWFAQLDTAAGDDRSVIIDQTVAAAVDVGLSEPGADVPAIIG